MELKLIVAMVKTDLTARVVDAAKKAGGTGATVVPARGTGIREAKTFFGLTLDAATDAILFLLEAHLVEKVMKAVSEAGEFRKPGTGIAFVLAVEQAVGLESQIKHFEDECQKLTTTV
jgi:nitrogen regulatory protein P-II 1